MYQYLKELQLCLILFFIYWMDFGMGNQSYDQCLFIGSYGIITQKSFIYRLLCFDMIDREGNQSLIPLVIG